MTTLAALTDATLNILYGLDSFEHPIEDRLDGGITASTETLAVDTPSMWAVDDFAEFRNNEVIRFINDAATSAKRGQRGTTAQVQADNAEMVKNPPFIRQQVEEQINSVIRVDTWPDIWTWHQDSLSVTDTDFMYDLDQYVEEVTLVYQANIDADNRWRPLPPGWWRVERQISTTHATNSNLLVIHRVFDYDETVFITAKRRPHVDDLANVSDEIADMVPWAAAGRLLAIRSPQIKNAASRSRRDQEGGLLRDYRALMAEFIRQKDQHMRHLQLEVKEDRRWQPATRSFHKSW